MNNKELQICRVCGLFTPDFFPWGESGDAPTFDYCDCCGTEFGYQDFTPIAAKANREVWIKAGAKWSESGARPKNWNLEEQLKNLPEKFR